KDIQKNINVDDIMSHYVKQISELGKIKLTENRIDRRINWVFGDYQINKYSNHEEFINNHERLYFSYLLNGNKENVKRYLDSEVKQTLKEAQVVKNKDYVYMCSSTFSILSFGYTSFHDAVKKFLEKDEKELKRLKIYNEKLIQL
ncbi:hypothetical protein COL98_29600, partial [Bacillus toyonensis]